MLEFQHLTIYKKAKLNHINCKNPNF